MHDLAKDENVVLSMKRIRHIFDGLQSEIAEVSFGLQRARSVEAPGWNVLELADRPTENLGLRTKFGSWLLSVNPYVLGSDLSQDSRLLELRLEMVAPHECAIK